MIVIEATYNFFFHPLHFQSEAKKAAALVTHIFLSVITLFLWQIPFWLVNNSRLKAKALSSLKRSDMPAVYIAS